MQALESLPAGRLPIGTTCSSIRRDAVSVYSFSQRLFRRAIERQMRLLGRSISTIEVERISTRMLADSGIS